MCIKLLRPYIFKFSNVLRSLFFQNKWIWGNNHDFPFSLFYSDLYGNLFWRENEGNLASERRLMINGRHAHTMLRRYLHNWQTYYFPWYFHNKSIWVDKRCFPFYRVHSIIFPSTFRLLKVSNAKGLSHLMSWDKLMKEHMHPDFPICGL